MQSILLQNGVGGIDPGKNGGIANIVGSQSSARKMPPTERDVCDLLENMIVSGVEKFYIERVASMPGQGVASSFKFGVSYGTLRGMLIALKIPFEEVTPRKWQKGIGIKARDKNESKTEFKNRLKAKAQQLFPHINMTLANCDAILIAEYGRRFELGLIK